VFGPWKGLTIARFSRLEMIELFAYREILEGLAAELSASSISDRTIEELQALVDAYQDFDDKAGVLLTRNNQKFHGIIYRATGNSYLIDSIGVLRTLLALLPFGGAAHRRPLKEIAAEHQALLDALRARDPVKSRQAAEAHVRNSAAALFAVILKEEVTSQFEPQPS
jgi:DNA-binding GntR family transcriptional regulator